MKLTGQPKVEAADPYVSRMTGGDFDYAALALCKGKIDAGGQLKDYDPPMDWTLSGEAKRYIENSVIATTPACNAAENAKTIDEVKAGFPPQLWLTGACEYVESVTHFVTIS